MKDKKYAHSYWDFFELYAPFFKAHILEENTDFSCDEFDLKGKKKL